MNDETQDKKNLRSLDAARIKKLQVTGHLGMLLDEFEKLRLKFYYDKLTERVEVLRFITLLKFMMINGPTESYRLSCSYMHEKYVSKWGL